MIFNKNYCNGRIRRKCLSFYVAFIVDVKKCVEYRCNMCVRNHYSASFYNLAINWLY
nr:MAG TPA: hypothetical protein [Caudoviricetes sp.]